GIAKPSFAVAGPTTERSCSASAPVSLGSNNLSAVGVLSMSRFYCRSLVFGLLVLAGLAQGTGTPLAADEKKPATDRYGDALPAGAIARLGTVRFRHASQVVSVGYSPNGKLLVTAGFDQAVRLWDTATGKEKFRFPLEGRPQKFGEQVLAFAPDGKAVA